MSAGERGRLGQRFHLNSLPCPLAYDLLEHVRVLGNFGERTNDASMGNMHAELSGLHWLTECIRLVPTPKGALAVLQTWR